MTPLFEHLFHLLTLSLLEGACIGIFPSCVRGSMHRTPLWPRFGPSTRRYFFLSYRCSFLPRVNVFPSRPRVSDGAREGNNALQSTLTHSLTHSILHSSLYPFVPRSFNRRPLEAFPRPLSAVVLRVRARSVCMYVRLGAREEVSMFPFPLLLLLLSNNLSFPIRHVLSVKMRHTAAASLVSNGIF